MSRLIDADALERDGWQMSRTVQIDKNTMEFQTRKPTDFPAIEPQRMRGRWEYLDYGGVGNYHCTACRRICVNKGDYEFCPHCGAWMVDSQESEVKNDFSKTGRCDQQRTDTDYH